MKVGNRRIWFFTGLFLLFSGLVVAITPTYMPKVFGLFLMILGLGVLVLTARGERVLKEEEQETPLKKEGVTVEKETLAEKMIRIITLKGKLKKFFPVMGILLVLFVYAFNLIFRGGLDLGVNDTVTMLLGATLVFYNYIPMRFATERDFVLLFFVFMFVILVLPITIYNILAGPIPESPNSPFIFWLLAQPTSDVLNFVGIPASAYSVPEGVYIDYKILGDIEGSGGFASVGIGLSCTGLYSVSIFISGFIAFILLEYGRFDLRVASLLTLGVFTSWFANILRMAIIVAVGSYYGRKALLFTHENLGIFIFMLWVGLFWALMFRLLVPKRLKDEDDGIENGGGETGDKSGSETQES